MNAESINVPYPDMDEYGSLTEGCGVSTIQEFIANFNSLPDKPTGIFIPCDAYLTIMQKSFAAKGLQPGKDVEFLGCNNDFSFDFNRLFCSIYLFFDNDYKGSQNVCTSKICIQCT